MVGPVQVSRTLPTRSDTTTVHGVRAADVITAIKESTFGPDSHLPTLGDWVDINGAATEANQYTPRSSDFMPAHFRAYGRSSGDSFWNQAVTAGQRTGFVSQTREQFHRIGHGHRPVVAEWARDHRILQLVLWRCEGRERWKRRWVLVFHGTIQAAQSGDFRTKCG